MISMAFSSACTGPDAHFAGCSSKGNDRSASLLFRPGLYNPSQAPRHRTMISCSMQHHHPSPSRIARNPLLQYPGQMAPRTGFSQNQCNNLESKAPEDLHHGPRRGKESGSHSRPRVPDEDGSWNERGRVPVCGVADRTTTFHMLQKSVEFFLERPHFFKII